MYIIAMEWGKCIVCVTTCTLNAFDNMQHKKRQPDL